MSLSSVHVRDIWIWDLKKGVHNSNSKPLNHPIFSADIDVWMCVDVCVCACAVCSVNIDDYAPSFSFSFFIYSSFAFSLTQLTHSHALYYSLPTSNINIRPSHMHITYTHLHAHTIHVVYSKTNTWGSVRRANVYGRILAHKNTQKREKNLSRQFHTYIHCNA